MPYHLERLAEGCARLAIPVPDTATLAAEIDAVMAGRDGVVKVIVTRGTGPRGYRPPAAPQPTRIVAGFAGEPPPRPAAGVRVRLCRTRLGRNPALAGIKHLGRLEQVLARAEWQDETIVEGLMLDEAGHVVCGTHSNLFVLRGRTLLTPRLDQCGVRGIMRRALWSWATERQIEVRETRLLPADWMDADEVLITNALRGALAVSEIDGLAQRVSGLAEEFTGWLERQS